MSQIRNMVRTWFEHGYSWNQHAFMSGGHGTNMRSCPGTGTSSCSLCGEGHSVPEFAKGRVLRSECRKDDWSGVTCGDVEKRVAKYSSRSAYCASNTTSEPSGPYWLNAVAVRELLDVTRIMCSCPQHGDQTGIQSGCNLCGEGQSVPETAKDRVLYVCLKDDGSEVFAFDFTRDDESSDFDLISEGGASVALSLRFR